MKLLLAMLLCAVVGCGGGKFYSAFDDQLYLTDGGIDSGSGGSAAGESGVAGAAGSQAGSGSTAGAEQAGSSGSSGNNQGGAPSAGNPGNGGTGSVATSGASGSAGGGNCTPLTCRDLTTGAVYCGTLTNACGETLDCGTSCEGAGTCGSSADPHLCSVTCKQPRCVDQHGQFTCGVQRNACGDEINCGLVFACDGTELHYDGTRVVAYPSGRCGSIPDGCGGFLTCQSACTAGTYCDANGVCQ